MARRPAAPLERTEAGRRPVGEDSPPAPDIVSLGDGTEEKASKGPRASVTWARNQVVRVGDGQDGILRRLLGADGPRWAWVTLPVGSSWPEWIHQTELDELLHKGKLSLLDDDPFRPQRAPSSKCQEEGERRWNILRKFLTPGDVSLLLPDSRPLALRELAEESGEDLPALRRWIRRYWERGQVPVGLAPSYSARGGPGKLKAASEEKRGAKPWDTPEGGPTPGINVDATIRKHIEWGTKTYRNGRRMKWREAWMRTLTHKFGRAAPTDAEVRRGPVLLPGYPSLHQFKYWGKKAFPDRAPKTVQDREGRNLYNARHRPALHSAKPQDLGPGAIAEIDPTEDNIFLVSRLDRAQISKRPWIYFIVDAFSTMVMGVHVQLRPPSWAAARMAILRSLENKVELCRRYGIVIEPEEWPTHHLACLYVADRAELLGKQSDQLVSEIHVRVANAPRQRADRKPHVERRIRTLQDTLTHLAPGRNHNLKDQEGKDYRYDASLTLDDYMYLIILNILEYNNHHLIQDRRSIPADYPVPLLGHPTPLQLWNWGVENRTGFLSAMDYEVARFALLPTDRVQVNTQRGILSHHAYYVPEDEKLEGWFVRNLRDGSQTVDRKEDESDKSMIWVRASPDEEWSRFVPSRSGDQWVRSLSADEINDAWTRGRKQTKRTEREAIKAHVAYAGLADQRIQEAISQRDARLKELGQKRVSLPVRSELSAGKSALATRSDRAAGSAPTEAAGESAGPPISRRRQRHLERQRQLDREAEALKEPQ
jgi:putative transposase